MLEIILLFYVASNPKTCKPLVQEFSKISSNVSNSAIRSKLMEDFMQNYQILDIFTRYNVPWTQLLENNVRFISPNMDIVNLQMKRCTFQSIAIRVWLWTRRVRSTKHSRCLLDLFTSSICYPPGATSTIPDLTVSSSMMRTEEK